MKEQRISAAKTQTAKNLPAKQSEIVDGVLRRVQDFQAKGELDLPPNYSAGNAMKSAWLILQTVENMSKKKLFNKGQLDTSVGTKESLANALLSMVVMGLNPDKKQGYFIIYGNQVTFQRSYFGAVAICKRVDKVLADIYAECVYADDKLTYKLDKGKRVIENHTQELANIDDKKIVAAYAVALDNDGNVKRSELMTIDEIKQAWKQSKTKPFNNDGSIKSDSTHGKFGAAMAKRTVTNRLAKMIINTSSDSDLLIKVAQQNDYDNEKAEAMAEVDENANQEVIDLNPGGKYDPVPDNELDREPRSTEMTDIGAEEQASMEEEKPY